MDITQSFSHINRHDTHLAGGKGASLGEMTEAGIPVPPGFVILTTAFENFIETADLHIDIEAILDSVNHQEIHTIEDASEKIHALILNTPIPRTMAQEIITAFKKLNTPYVAVRSSATAEDSLGAAWAGQLDSFLNTREEHLLDNVRKCWASLFTPRAIFYRFEKGLHTQKISVAVVVQKMVDSDVSGIAFSVHPVTEDHNQLIIEAALGLGEAIVSGQVTPDSYVVTKQPREIIDKNIATQERGLYRSAKAGNEWRDLFEKGKNAVLNDEQILALTDMVVHIEEHYDFPVDVEWAIENDELYIVQSRPITTLNHTSESTSEKPVHRPQWLRLIAREYGVHYTQLSLRSLSPILKDIVIEPFYEQIYIPQDSNEVCYVDQEKWKAFVQSVKETYMNPNGFAKLEEGFLRTGNNYVDVCKKIFEHPNLLTLSTEELLTLYMAYQEANLYYAPHIWLAFLINDFYSKEAQTIIEQHYDNSDVPSRIKELLTPDEKAAVIHLQEYTKKWNSLTKKEKEKVYEEFCWIPCLDLHFPPWTKEQFFSQMENDASNIEPEESTDKETRVKDYPFTETEQYIINTSRRLAYLKDLKDDFRRSGCYYARPLFAEISRRINTKGYDVSYLLEEEVVDALHHKISTGTLEKVIKERKQGFVIFFDAQHKIQCLTEQDADNFVEALQLPSATQTKNEVKGIGASKGVKQGRVTIVKTAADLTKVKKGDVFVALTTHPDYVPFMRKACAIVTDEGGITSHAAIVSRELGIPCIVGTENATKFLKDGDLVEVDATSGRVTILPK